MIAAHLYSSLEFLEVIYAYKSFVPEGTEMPEGCQFKLAALFNLLLLTSCLADKSAPNLDDL